MRNYMFVRGHDGLASGERGRDEGMSRLVATDQFDDHVRGGIGHQMGRRIGQEGGGQTADAGSFNIADGDADELESRAIVDL
jgi:hypothetical protein